MVGGSDPRDTTYSLSRTRSPVGKFSRASAASLSLQRQNARSATEIVHRRRGGTREGVHGERERERETECERDRECEPGVTSYRRKTVDYVCLTPHFRKATVMFEHEK